MKVTNKYNVKTTTLKVGDVFSWDNAVIGSLNQPMVLMH